ncbi:MAG: HEAT repeat domain-containing protein, partial [Deltaproteobacteria bacterium]
MRRTGSALLAAGAVMAFLPHAAAFIDSPDHPPERYTLSAVHQNAWIAALKVERVDVDRAVVVYELVEQIQGKDWPKRLKHSIKLDGKVPRGLDKLVAGEDAICFAWDRQFTLLVTFIGHSWYLSTVERNDPSWCRITRQRPDLNCLFVGPVGELADAFKELGAGRETIVRCQKRKRDPATQFVRCIPTKPRSKQPVPALDHVAANLPAELGPEAKDAVPALLKALKHEDPLVQEAAARILKEIDPD